MRPISRTVEKAPRALKDGISRQSFRPKSQPRDSVPGSSPRSFEYGSSPRKLVPGSSPREFKTGVAPQLGKSKYSTRSHQPILQHERDGVAATLNMQSAARKVDNEKPWQSRPHAFTYDSNWREERMKELLKGAFHAGFRRIDTSTIQRLKRERERLLGNALRDAYSEGHVKREDIYIQAKLIPDATAEEINAPPRRDSPLQAKIEASVTLVLDHFRHLETSSEGAYIDCLMVHMPKHTNGQVLKVWRLLEPYVPHQIRTLGLSQTSHAALKNVCDKLEIKPSVVQDRFFLKPCFDGPSRDVCRRRGISYQAIWTRSGHDYQRLLESKLVTTLAREAEVNSEIALRALVEGLGIEVLHSNTSLEIMRETVLYIEKVRKYAEENAEAWVKLRRVFKDLVGDVVYDDEDLR